jgi:flagellum-specific ATP synthase
MSVFAPSFSILNGVQPMRLVGRVAGVRGLSLAVDELVVPVGTLVAVGPPGTWTSGRPITRGTGTLGEVVGFSKSQAIVMLLGQTLGISPGDEVAVEQVVQVAPASWRMLGRVVDGLGRAIDGKGTIAGATPTPLSPDPMPALRRRRIDTPMLTGVRALDLMTTLGRGQRLGIFAGPGVGKSTLLGTIAKRSNSDINVIALIGERGREVKDFLSHSLGDEGLSRSVLVVATGDESPLMRIRAARLASCVAEFFRDQGKHVLLMMDSITRFAHAQRQVGLSVGEPPATKGYTPSVFANLALLLERAGALEGEGSTGGRVGGGSITGLYTILVEGDDLTEPVSDAARGILDGHVILTRKLANRAHYPAVDVLDSISRVADDVTDKEHQEARRKILRLMAIYRDVEDLVNIGAYAKGSNPEADVAIELQPQIMAMLRQGREESTPFPAAREMLLKVAAMSEMKKAVPAKGKKAAA